MDNQSKGNDPPREKQRGPIPSIVTSTTTITDLDDAAFGTVLEFLPGHFRLVAGVNRRFRVLYHHRPSTCYSAAMTSDATRAMWLEEDRAEVRRHGCSRAAKYGNFEPSNGFALTIANGVLLFFAERRLVKAICISCSGLGRRHHPSNGTHGCVQPPQKRA